MKHGTDRAIALVHWWVNAYTATAPEPAAAERRAELDSDIFEQLASWPETGAGRAPRALLSRTVRGVWADLAWRLQVERAPGRHDWHLAHPTTALGASLVIGCTLEVFWDSSVTRVPLIAPLAAAVHPALFVWWALTLAWAAYALARTVVRLRPQAWKGVTVATWRRACMCTMSVTFALSGLWRFAPDGRSDVAAFAWAAFGLALVALVGTWLVRAVGLALRSLDLRKV